MKKLFPYKKSSNVKPNSRYLF